MLDQLLNFDSANITHKGPSITLNTMPTEEIKSIAPLMKFVCREKPTKELYDTLDDYLDWKKKMIGEPEKNVKFVTVLGASGIGKTTFARRFIDLPYSGEYQDVIEDCRENNRIYRVSCTDFDTTRDPKTHFSLLLLYEAFKYSVADSSSNFYDDFYCKFNRTLELYDVLQLITESFSLKSSHPPNKRLMIINLNEINVLLDCKNGANYLQNLFNILHRASISFTLLILLSGNNADLLNLAQVSCRRFVAVELSLIELESAKDVLLEMVPNPHEYGISTHLEHLLTLCGGVGRYIEIVIIQKSMMGASNMDGKNTSLQCQ